MTIRDKNAVAEPVRVNRLPLILDVYARTLAVVMMLLGLRQWAIILGIHEGCGGMFEEMSASWQIATMHLAVADLVAAVGLWMRVAWGNVVWIYAALSEIALHTVFISTFGSDMLVVAFHFATLAGFAILFIMSRRAEAR